VSALRNTFKHLVGKSTLTQGIAIRRDYEEWFDAPGRGECREITLLFGSHEIAVTLRRLDNENGSVQIRYESKRHAALRAWLHTVFAPFLAGESPYPGLLELRKVDSDNYRLEPLRAEDACRLRLCLGPGLYHNGAESLGAASHPFAEIPEVIGSVGFRPEYGQTQYNEHIRTVFVERGWRSDEPVVPELPLRFDFRKDDYQVEVEFGNARSYYQDYLKFLLPFTRGIIRVGVLLVPTADFARLLCAGGTRRATNRATRAGLQLDRPPKYSGMVTYEKVEREFQALRFILNMPVIVRGIDFWGQA